MVRSVNPEQLQPVAQPTESSQPAWPYEQMRELKHVHEKLFKHIGRPVERKEDGRLITGRGRFSDDFNVPGQTYAAMVRSPHPHARIRGIEIEDALASPGVLAVLTSADCVADRNSVVEGKRRA